VDVPVVPTLPRYRDGPVAISFSFYFKTEKPPVSQGLKEEMSVLDAD
jgi:hypothetical protein